MFYEVRRTILDNINGHLLQRGTVVETDELAWVNRFGADLKRMETIGAHIKPVKIFGTAESIVPEEKVEVAEEVKKAEPTPEPETQPAEKKVVRRQTTKVVTGDDSDAK